MTIGVRACRLLARSQRETLALMRGAMVSGVSAPAPASVSAEERPFADLAHACRAARIALGPPPCRYVTHDEALILAALAALQRPALGACLAEVPLRAPLAACAADLAARGAVLPLAATAWATLVAQGWASARKPGRAPNVAERQRVAASRPPAPPKSGSLRHRAVTFAAGRSTITTAEFDAVGISRQTLSLICAEGLLERIGLGRYRLAAPAQPRSSHRDRRRDQVRSTKGMVTSPFTSTGLPLRTIGDQRQ